MRRIDRFVRRHYSAVNLQPAAACPWGAIGAGHAAVRSGNGMIVALHGSMAPAEPFDLESATTLTSRATRPGKDAPTACAD